MAWVLLLFVPIILYSSRRIGRQVRSNDSQRSGQAGGSAEHFARDHHRQPNRQGFGMESWEAGRYRKAAQRFFRANLRSVAAAAVSSPLMDIIGAVAIALLLLLGRDQINKGVFTPGNISRIHHRGSQALRSGTEVCVVQ